ncbi:hypothetical protein [Streptomyces sp. N2A]|uniref:hypothetical protein n=1 Tax=Streptomyces sp. N2A TaxID=3073936 RepID=UPI002870B1AD|nr:hypothetical protein [Streptomyces sp. N2A]
MTQALERDARALLTAYEEGTWRPTAEELLLAEGLARSPWEETAFRTALRAVPDDDRGGRLVEVLDPATAILQAVDTYGAWPALVALRQLIDALADQGADSAASTYR